MLITSMDELQAYLRDAQSQRVSHIACSLTATLSARLSDDALTQALVIALPMAQGIERRILRSRGKGIRLTAKLRYRSGVRMLDHLRGTGAPLDPDEETALQQATDLAAQFAAPDEGMCFCQLYDWVCRHIRYENAVPGRNGYEALVSSCSAIHNGEANCQGFADVVYLLCGLCGIQAEYCCDRGNRRLHVWNTVCINGQWRTVDASRGARKRCD